MAEYTGAAVTNGGNSELDSTVALANSAIAKHGSEVPSFGPSAGSNSEHVAIYQGGSSSSGHGGHDSWDDKGGFGYGSGNNTATVAQDGARNSSTLIYQDGQNNTLNTLQTADSSLLYIRQSGGKNNTIGTGLLSSKNGGSSGNAFTQSGSKNQMVINQDQSDNHIYSPGQSGTNNKAVIYQKGKNDLTANLSGNYNEAYISQNGSGQTSTVTQSGSFNDLTLKQKGYYNTANLTQTGGGYYNGQNDRGGSNGHSNWGNGGNVMDVTQLGNNNLATVNQNGSSNNITLAQNSTNGIATIDQSGGTSRNTVTATTNVNNGLVDVDQVSGTKNSDVTITQNGGGGWDRSFDDDKNHGNHGMLVSAAKVLQSGSSDSNVTISQTVAGISTTAYVQQAGSNNIANVTQR
jgi:Curlin associated repeat.